MNGILKDPIFQLSSTFNSYIFWRLLFVTFVYLGFCSVAIFQLSSTFNPDIFWRLLFVTFCPSGFVVLPFSNFQVLSTLTFFDDYFLLHFVPRIVTFCPTIVTFCPSDLYILSLGSLLSNWKILRFFGFGKLANKNES